MSTIYDVQPSADYIIAHECLLYKLQGEVDALRYLQEAFDLAQKKQTPALTLIRQLTRNSKVQPSLQMADQQRADDLNASYARGWGETLSATLDALKKMRPLDSPRNEESES